MGTVRKGSKSSIEYRFKLDGKRYIVRERLAPTPQNLRYAKRRLGEIENAIHFGTFTWGEYFPSSIHARSEAVLVNDFLRKWLEEAKRSPMAKSTLYRYEKAISSRLAPYFRQKDMASLSRQDIRRFIDSYATPIRRNPTT